MRLLFHRERLRLRSPFALSHGTSTSRETVLVALEDAGARGYGEIPIVPYYGIDPDMVTDQLREIATLLRGRSLRIATAARIEKTDAWHPFVRAGVSEALVECIAAIEKRSRASVLGQRSVVRCLSSWTIAERDQQRALSLLRSVDTHTIKVKTGFAGDVELVRALVDADPARTYWIDCNGGWEGAEAADRARAMERLGVALIEEPVKHDFAALQRVAEAVTVPVVADESVRTVADLRTMLSDAPAAGGIVVKIAKHGGPLATREIVRTVRDAGKEYLLGQMVESSVGTARALDFASFASWVDLDAPLLVENDPGTGLNIRPGYVSTVGAHGGSVRPSITFMPIDA